MSRSLFMIISLVLFIVGLFVIVGSVSWGHDAANAYLRSQGGSMDAAQFAIVFQENINTYRWIGGILSIISGLAFVKAIELR
jgi:TRAP-type C4-dicarboxylate transport system permease small subunit